MKGKTGNLGNEVKLHKEKNMLTLTSEVPFSKRCVCENPFARVLPSSQKLKQGSPSLRIFYIIVLVLKWMQLIIQSKLYSV